MSFEDLHLDEIFNQMDQEIRRNSSTAARPITRRRGSDYAIDRSLQIVPIDLEMRPAQSSSFISEATTINIPFNGKSDDVKIIVPEESWRSDRNSGYFTPRTTIKRRASTSGASVVSPTRPRKRKQTMPEIVCQLPEENEDVEEKDDNRRPVSGIGPGEYMVSIGHPFERINKKARSASEQFECYLDVAKLQLKRMSEQITKSPLESGRPNNGSLASLSDAAKVQFALAQTPPMSSGQGNNFSPILQSFSREHRGELDMAEKYNYDLSKAQLKASSRTSALLAGFAMVALVELQYDADTPASLLVLLGVVTTLLVSVHLLALMMSTCILPYMEATGCTQDSPHLRLKFYIQLSWIFSTCIGLLLFLVEIGIIFFVKFKAVQYITAGYITTAMLIPVVIIFIVFSYLIHRSRVSHSLGRFKHKVDTMKQFLDVEAQLPKTSTSPTIKNV